MSCILHREIGIDVGHRVPDHKSKCRNPHGHRYRIIATCRGPIIDQHGHEENGMIIDFGNVKKYMMDWLDAVFDHGFVVYYKDDVMMKMFFPASYKFPSSILTNFNKIWEEQQENYSNVQEPMHLPTTVDKFKVIVVDYVPTAENLAKHMFSLLKKPIEQHYNGEVELINLRLYETPNGYVDYPGHQYIAP